MPTPRFIRPAGSTFTEKYQGLDSFVKSFQRASYGGSSPLPYGVTVKTIAANDTLTLAAPAASINYGGQQITFLAPKSFASLYSSGASMGTGAEYLRLRNAQSQNYLSGKFTR